MVGSILSIRTLLTEFKMKKKVRISNSDFLEIVSDGAIANSLAADGRLIPVLIVNSSKNNSLSNLIELHSDSSPGDVKSFWATNRFSDRFVFLTLIFERPAEFRMSIKFEVNKHSSLIDGVILSRAVYIQSEKSGDKLGHDIDAPKILVEIPARTTFDRWDDILIKSVKKRFKREGVSRKHLNRVTSEYISTTREVWGRRLTR